MVARLRARLSWLDVACLTFGYLQILAAVALTMVAVWAACVESVGPRPVFSDICPRLTIRILLTTITLVFAAMLVKGVHIRKEGHVLSYFVFGVVAAAGLVVQGTLLAAFEVDSLIACTIFLLIAVYALCLLMVYVVYRNIRLEKRPEHGPQNTPHEPKDTV